MKKAMSLNFSLFSHSISLLFLNSLNIYMCRHNIPASGYYLPKSHSNFCARSPLENIAKKVPDYKTNDSFHFLFFLLTFPVDKPQCRTAESKCFPDFIFNIACV